MGTTAHLLCQSTPHGHVPVNQEHSGTKENVATNVQHSVVLTKIRLVFTVRATKDIAVIKELSVMAITNVFQNIHTVHHHATTLMKNSECVHVIKNVISQRNFVHVII